MEAPRSLRCQCRVDHSYPVLLWNAALPIKLSLEELKSVCWEFLCKHHLVFFPRQYPLGFAQTLDLWWRHDDVSK